MSRIFEGHAHVNYHQFYIEQEDRNEGDMHAAFQGQTNGLCGAAIPGVLYLVTGLHTGEVGFTLDVLDGPPPLDLAWEEIVEATLLVEEGPIAMVDWNGDPVCEIPLEPGTYRVRYCGRDMDRGKEVDTNLPGSPPTDTYSLVCWPAPPAPDAILKQTSAQADYQHQAFGGGKSVPRPPSE